MSENTRSENAKMKISRYTISTTQGVSKSFRWKDLSEDLKALRSKIFEVFVRKIVILKRDLQSFTNFRPFVTFIEFSLNTSLLVGTRQSTPCKLYSVHIP